MAKVVITAPLWGRVSNPPEDREAILWRISGEIFIAWLICSLTHKEAYKDMFVTSVLIPIFTTAIIVLLVSMKFAV